MKSKRAVFILVIVAMFALMVGTVGAQDNPPPPQPGGDIIRDVIDIVAAETGLEAEDVLTKLRERPTLEDIILANGGDIEVVVAEAVSAITERINDAVAAGDMPQERADQLLTNLEDVVRKGLSGELHPDGQRRESLRERAEQAVLHNLLDAVVEATGLEQRDIIEQVRQGEATLAEVIEVNGGSVDAVIADAVAFSTEQINNLVAEDKLNQEQADEIIASLETFYTDVVNGELPPRPERPDQIQAIASRALMQMIAEQTGLEVQDVLNQLKDGVTIADILSANGVDVNTFIDDAMAQAQTRIDDAVAKGRMTQERADEMMEKLREQLTDRINNPRPQPEVEA